MTAIPFWVDIGLWVIVGIYMVLNEIRTHFIQKMLSICGEFMFGEEGKLN